MKTNEIEKIIGYTFKDKSLLERAYTHGSAQTDATKNYQSLEFLGDSILDFVIAKKLMELHPKAHEGALTKLRAGIVSKQPLADLIDELDLAKYLIVGKGENHENIISQTKIKSDIFEALVAAIYYDSGDINQAEKFILDKLKNIISGKNKQSVQIDYKSKLNEYRLKEKIEVDYKLISQSGKPNEPTYLVAVYLNDKKFGKGIGSSIKRAEQEAAKDALSRLND